MKDILGAACSGLCLIHCLGLSFLTVTGASFVGSAYVFEESTHLWLSVVMICIVLWAFPSGWRIHKCLLPSIFMLLGIGLMAVALIVPESMEVYWSVVSGVALLAAHVLNRHFIGRHKNLIT